MHTGRDKAMISLPLPLPEWSPSPAWWVTLRAALRAGKPWQEHGAGGWPMSLWAFQGHLAGNPAPSASKEG